VSPGNVGNAKNSGTAAPDAASSIRAESKGKILLFSYAFPPMQVQMTAAVYKPMAAIARSGYEVDVLCADSFCPELPLERSLVPFAEKTFARIERLRPASGLLAQLRSATRVLDRVPDLMTVLRTSAYHKLMDMDLSRYDAVMTWSPFHSINAVMTRVKKARPSIKWLAQFSDPWAGNPLEISRLTKAWNAWYEPRAVAAADFIVHSSRYSLDLMMRDQPESVRRRTNVIPHAYDEALFPQRPKSQNDRIVMRYVGVLYGRRSPEPLFQALVRLFDRRPELRSQLCVELIGLVPPEMLASSAAKSLPEGTVRAVGNVSFVESLERMYDADILLLIEANIRQNLFLPSKLSDYIGADTPIVGLTPPGGSEDAMRRLSCWYARPSDVEGIEKAVEGAVDHVRRRDGSPWCDHVYRDSFSGRQIAQRFGSILERL
jgi:glycosyltransferase involved in cell wall biosynthesis